MNNEPAIQTEGGAVVQGPVHLQDGDFVGRDKIIHQLTQFVQQIQATSPSEEAAKAHALALQQLAESVRGYVERIGTTAADQEDAIQGGPYRGLLHYTIRDAEIFYGRDQAIATLCQHLQRNPLTVLQSESGAGKSSLLRAGLAHALLTDGSLPIVLRPHNRSPKLQIQQTLLPDFAATPTWRDTTLRYFLHQVVHTLGPNATLYILLDQFEEFFTLDLSEEERQQFITELAECLEDDTLRVKWLLALRSEYFGRLATFRPQIEPFHNDYRLERLRRENVLEVINRPVQLIGVAYEAALQEQLLQALSSADGQWFAPAQIQLICTSLYEAFLAEQTAAPAAPKVITLALYEREGGVHGILGNHLQRVLNRRFAQEDERDLARQILIALVTPTQERERLTYTQLADRVLPKSQIPEKLPTSLHELQQSRLLTVEKEDYAPTAYYELAHDLLVNEIQIDPEIEMQKVAQELLDRESEAHGRFQTLLRVDKFNLIKTQEHHLHVNEDAQHLLVASEAAIHAEVREKENRIRLLIGASLLAVVLAVAATLFGLQANAREAESRSQSLAARSILMLEQDAEESLRLALEASEIKHTVAAEEALRQSLHEYRVVRQVTHGVTTSIKSSFNNDRTLVAIAGQSGKIEVRVPQSGELRQSFKHDAAITHLQFFPTSDQWLLAANRKGETIIHNVITGATEFVDQSPFPGETTAIAVSPNEVYLALGQIASQSMRILDLQQNKQVGQLEGLIPYKLIFSDISNYHYLVAGGADGKLHLMDLAQGIVGPWQGHENWIMDVVFHPTLPLFASGGQDKLIRVWGLPTSGITTEYLADIRDDPAELMRFEFDEINGTITALAFNHDGSCLAAAGEDGSVALWYVAEQPHLWLKPGQHVLSLHGHTKLTHGLAFGVADDTAAAAPTEACGKKLYTSSDDGTIRQWNIGVTQEIQTLTAHAEPVEQVTFSPDGRFLATASDDGTARIFAASAEHQFSPHHTITHAARVDDIAFSHDGNHVVTASRDGDATVVAMADPLSERRFSHPGRRYSASFTPDGSSIVTVGDQAATVGKGEPPTGSPGNISLWNIETQEQISQKIHDDQIYHIVPRLNGSNSNGMQFVTASRDGTAKVMTLTAAHFVESTVFPHSGEAAVGDAIVGQRDSKRLFTATFMGEVLVWSLKDGAQLDAIQAHRGPIYGLATGVAPNKRPLLATASGDGVVRLWDEETLDPISTLPGHLDGVNSVSFHPAAPLVATASDDGTVRIYTLALETLQELARQRLAEAHSTE